MDREQWKIVLGAVRRAARQVAGACPPGRRPRFADWLIVAMYLWAVAHDRCQSWACDRSHYNGVFRPRGPLPSVSQFNRRVAGERARLILGRVHEELGGELTATALSYLDGKPLTVGPASKDGDARRGHVLGGFAKGYKLHAWMTEDRRIPLWCVTPLNVHEVPVARLLVRQVGELSDRSLTLADQNYDAHDLHKELHAYNGRLLVWPKGPQKLDQRHPVTLRQMGPARRQLVAAQDRCPSLLRMVLRQRVNAEGILGNLCGYGGGLTGLPPWVRRLHRVRRWVGGKIILYHAKLRARAANKKAA
jgi:Transposase DDE domain